jgi:hypothetical protein
MINYSTFIAAETREIATSVFGGLLCYAQQVVPLQVV